MTGKDKDYRYMAASDLLSELNKENFKAGQDPEPKLTNIILQQLEDASGDVSGLAVKCLAPLVKKVSEDRVVEMTNKLCEKLLNGKDQHRDTASIALKTIIVEVTTPSLAEKILVSLAPQLLNGVTSRKSSEIKCECLNILSDVLNRFGYMIAEDHAYMLTALLSQLSSNRASVRKKSVTCIASLAQCLSDDLLTKITSEVFQLLKNRNAKSEITRTNIQMIGALSRSVGYRFGPHLAEAVPLLINYCTSASENDEELREYSLHALESFILRCPRDISPYCEGILSLALEYVSYAPNFADSMEDSDDEVQDEEDDDESAHEYTDDEDASWKVRRASAKCLSAIIVSCPQTLSKMYQEAFAKLIDRFREREENVKMDIFNAFIELLRQTANVTKGQCDIDESSPRWLLKQEVPEVVKSINRQLREKSIKTKVGAFSVLKELVIVLPDCLADHIGSLVPGIETVLNDKSSTSNQKIEALASTRILMASHSPSVFHPYIEALSGSILSAIGDRYYKVTAEALRVCEELVHVLRPNAAEACSINFRPYIGPIYKATFARLANQDQDQEVKECAISCMSLVISTFGDCLQRELPSCLPILVDRMGNEITRLTAVKAFAVIASSPLRIDLKSVLDHVVFELTAFLPKANRALRQATLETLNSLVVTYGGQISSSSYETIIAELSTLISDIDLHMAALSLELCCTVMVNRRSIPSVGLAVRKKILPQALILIRSALLQGQALQNFFASLVQSTNTSFETLLDSPISTSKPSRSGSLAKQALSSIAQCVAVLCLAAGDQKCASTIEMLKGLLKDDSSTNSYFNALSVPPAAAAKRKRIIMGSGGGAAPPTSVVDGSSLPPSVPSQWRSKTVGSGAKKTKKPATRGPTPPPAVTPLVTRTPTLSNTNITAHHKLDKTLESFNMHSAPILYVSTLDEVEVNIDSALVDSFDNNYGDDVEEVEEEVYGDDVEEVEEEFFDVSQKNGRSKNYTEFEDIALVKAWASVSLDAVIGNDQTRKKYWERIEDKFHQFIPEQSRSRRSLRSRYDAIKQSCSRWSDCLEQVRNAPPSGCTIDDYDRIAQERYKQMAASKGKSFVLQHCWKLLEHSEKWKLKARAFPAKMELAEKNQQDKMTICQQITDNEAKKLNEKKRNDIEERRLRLEENKMRVETIVEESRIMLMDLSGMDDNTRKYWENRKREILQSLRSRLGAMGGGGSASGGGVVGQ